MQYVDMIAQINSNGGIEASWVLTGITSFAVALFWNQLKDIKRSIADISKLVQMHDKDIAVLKDRDNKRDDTK